MKKLLGFALIGLGIFLLPSQTLLVGIICIISGAVIAFYTEGNK